MSPSARVYRCTEQGTKAVNSVRITMSPEMYRVLQSIHGDTHEDVIRGRTMDLEDDVRRDTLVLLEELGFLRSSVAKTDDDLDFTQIFKRPVLAQPPAGPVEKQRIAREIGVANQALDRRGVYVAEARVRNRPPGKGAAGDHSVLIVEDDADQAALTRRALELHGLRTTLVANRAGFVRALRHPPPPSLVLLDVNLPDGNGFEILARIRAHPGLAHLPVVMLTIRGSDKDIELGLRTGADAYIVKPCAIRPLIEALFKVLRISPGAKPAPAVSPVRKPPPAARPAPAAPSARIASPPPASASVTLPARSVQQAATAGRALEQRGVYLATRRLKNRQPAPRTGSAMDILLVEDDADQASLVRRHLESAKYRVRHAPSAAVLLRELRRAPTALVLLDAMLPDGDGFQILTKLRAHPSYAEQPVVMLTAKGKLEDIAHGLKLGADGYIVKPCSKEVLLDTVAKVLLLSRE